MKNLVVLFALLISPFFINAQDYQPENEGWLVNFEEAYEVSKKTGKPIMANFTGSDWCGWCKRLTKSVFSQPGFKSWSDDNVVLLELDYPKRKSVPAEIQKQNNNLRQAFRISGYPTVWVFHIEKDEKGEYNIDPIGKTGYKRTVEEFTDDVEKMMKSHSSNSRS